MWTTEQAIALCRLVESICPVFGCHVALTGGLLYKDGPRKDADIVLYRIRQHDEIDVDGLFVALARLGIERLTMRNVWCIKARYQGRDVDFFFPDHVEGDYAPQEVSTDPVGEQTQDNAEVSF